MSADPILLVFWLVGFVIIGIPAILIVLFMVRSVGKMRREASAPGQQQLLAEAHGWLDEQRATLAPWTPDRVYDISTARNWRSTSFTTDKTWGSVNSFHNNNEPILAYYILHTWDKRHCLVRSAADQWHMHWEGMTIHIRYNNEPFGSWTDDGVLRDTSGNPVGLAKRLWLVDYQGLPTTFEGRRYDVMLRGRLVGRVLAQHGLKDINFLMALRKLQVVDAAGLDPDEEARRWLYALACVELTAFNEIKLR